MVLDCNVCLYPTATPTTIPMLSPEVVTLGGWRGYKQTNKPSLHPIPSAPSPPLSVTSLSWIKTARYSSWRGMLSVSVQHFTPSTLIVKIHGSQQTCVSLKNLTPQVVLLPIHTTCVFSSVTLNPDICEICVIVLITSLNDSSLPSRHKEVSSANCDNSTFSFSLIPLIIK